MQFPANLTLNKFPSLQNGTLKNPANLEILPGGLTTR